MNDIIAAIATGKVPCAIGILRLSGPGCAEVAGQVFRPHSGRELKDSPPHKLVLGTVTDRKGRIIDEALGVYCPAPHSYTGEDTVELQCHGSPAMLSAALEALFAKGARQAGPGEFTKRAFLNGQLDLTQAEAVIDLIDAESAEAAANAAGQLGGALQRRIDPIYDAMTDLCSHFHAVLDYPDEDIEDFQIPELSSVLQNSKSALRKLLATYDRGKHLKHGVKTVLLGRPNAGKSSLLNALAGYDRVIVTEIAGFRPAVVTVCQGNDTDACRHRSGAHRRKARNQQKIFFLIHGFCSLIFFSPSNRHRQVPHQLFLEDKE